MALPPALSGQVAQRPDCHGQDPLWIWTAPIYLLRCVSRQVQKAQSEPGILDPLWVGESSQK